MNKRRERRSIEDPGLAARYLAADEGDVSDMDAFPEPPASAEIDDLARCDAVMALMPKLANEPEVAWVFDEARRIARSAPVTSSSMPWYQRPMLAWSIAGIAASICLVLMALLNVMDETTSGLAERYVADSNASATPVRVLADIENRTANIDPVVTIADNVPVDGRSIVVMPFTSAPTRKGADLATINATADVMYQRTVQQFASIPGFYVVEPKVAAAYSGLEYTSEQIAQFLSVRTVVHGSVDSDGQMVSLGLHFTDAAGNGTEMERDFAVPIGELEMIDGEITASLLDALGASVPAVK